MTDTYSSRIPQPFQNIGCQELLKEPTAHCGWVRKRHFASKLKLFRWPKVYMVISKGCVYYFRNEFCKSLSGKFSLFGFNSVTRATEIKESEALFAFKIDHIHKNEFKSYYFSCSSEKEMKQWMKVIKDELKIANDAQKREGDYYYTQGFSSKTEQTPEAQGSSADSGFENSNDGDAISMTYKDIEESIYDDPTSFEPPSDYGLYAKRADEASDDEDIPDEPPPVPPRLASNSSDGKKKKKKKKKKRKDGEVSDVSKVQVSRTQSEAKEAAGVLASEMKDLFSKKKHSITEDISSGREKKQSRGVETPPPEVADEEEEDEDDEGDKYWKAIHFDGDREEASEIIRNIGEDGVFLVRKGDGDAGKVLVVFADNMPKKYKINSQNEQFYIQLAGPRAETIEELLFEYFTTDLPNTKIKLTTPFQLHSKYQ